MVFVAQTFPNTILRERHFNMLEYQMPSASVSLAKIFGTFDDNKQRFRIEDYSVSQTTLDQASFHIVGMQRACVCVTCDWEGFVSMLDGIGYM